ncbi:MAG: hypothetical protein WD021_01230 [Rhodothermales bacterium]
MLFLVGSLTLTLAAHAQLGASLGYGLNVISQPNYSGPSNSFESTGGVNAGLFYNFPVGQIDIRPSMFFQKNDFSWELDGVEIFSPIEGDFRVAGFAFDLRYRFSADENSPYVLLGPEVNYVAANRAELRTVLDYEKGSTKYTRINIGAGYRVQFPSLGIALEPEVRYSHALAGFMEQDFIVHTIEYSGDAQRSMSNLIFRVGFTFLGFE